MYTDDVDKGYYNIIPKAYNLMANLIWWFEPKTAKIKNIYLYGASCILHSHNIVHDKYRCSVIHFYLQSNENTLPNTDSIIGEITLVN